MTPLAVVDAQTLVDAVGLGAVYALMAVGIGLVFGVLRLVNFAYGQLVMAGAYTLAFTSGWPTLASLAACLVVVVALSTAMDYAVFRPLRGHSPAVMLNLLGDLWFRGAGADAGGGASAAFDPAAAVEPPWQRVLAVPGAHLHLYGKREARPGRKMGHVTRLSAKRGLQRRG